MITKSGISLAKKPIEKSQQKRIASRNIVFYHEATSGQTTISLSALSMPSSITMTQATLQEISGAMLFVNKKNLTLMSSLNGQLVQGLDYDVASSMAITLKGPYLGVGAELGEIFIGTISAAPISDLTVASATSIVNDYTLAVGQSILALGNSYKVGGAMKVFINGVLGRKGEDYNEVSDGTGSGYGSSIQVLSMPVTAPYKITVDFGVRAITDTNALGAIENLSGSILKLATDVADLAGTQASDYYSASPAEVDRRTYGDSVLALLSRVSALEAAVVAQPLTVMYRSVTPQSIANNGVILMNYEVQEFSNAPAGSVVNSGTFSYTVKPGYDGTYDISAGFGVGFGANATQMQMYVYILKNGATIRESGYNVTQGGAAVFPTASVSSPVRLAVGDIITIQAYQQSGAARSTTSLVGDNYVTIIRRSN